MTDENVFDCPGCGRRFVVQVGERVGDVIWCGACFDKIKKSKWVGRLLACIASPTRFVSRRGNG